MDKYLTRRTIATCSEVSVLNIWVNLCVLFSVMPIMLATGAESNAVSYWIDCGNDQFNHGNYTSAVECYDKAIALGNQTKAPIFNGIAAQCGYQMDAIDKNNRTQTFSKICAEPASPIKGQPNQDLEPLILCFDVTNPNEMHMMISNLYVDVIKYNTIANPKIIQNFSLGHTRRYFCNIEPEIRSYKCVLTSKDHDFIDLAPNELEHIAINVSTDTPGVYKLRISSDYAIGHESNRIVVGDVPGLIGFFDTSFINEAV